MSVPTVTATNDTTAASSTATAKDNDIFSSKLDGNAFLTLFLTQLQYQDPTNPMESYEMAAQLAQFSSVERLAGINSSLSRLESALSSLGNSQMVGLIGKEVVAQSNTLRVTDGTASEATYSFDLASGDPATVTITISDENGSVVRTKTLTGQAGGDHKVAWDGLDDAGNKAPDGSYIFAVKAYDSIGNALDVTSTVTGLAYSYRLDQTSPYLILDGPGGVRVPTGNILAITQTTAS